MNHPRGWKQKRVHFHAKRKLSEQKRKFDKAVMDGFVEHYRMSAEASKHGIEVISRLLSIPTQPIVGRFIVFPVTLSRESGKIEAELRREALGRSYRVQGAPR